MTSYHYNPLKICKYSPIKTPIDLELTLSNIKIYVYMQQIKNTRIDI